MAGGEHSALVTGATGFIGTFLCEELRSRGIRVRAALRRPREMPAADETVVVGEIDGRTDWTEALDGVSQVFHIAGMAHQTRRSQRDDERIFSVNTDGTAALAKACRGGQRLVFLSTVKVHGESTAGQPFRETDRPVPADLYARSKWQAEIAVREVLPAQQVTIVRTPLVYGPGVRANFLKLMELVDRQLPIPLGAIRNRRSMIFVRNLTHALATAAAKEEAAGETFLVSDNEDVSSAELVRRIARALGRKPRLVPIPPAFLKALATVTGRSATLEKIAGDLEVDTSHFSQRIGWRPPFSMTQGLAETAEWFRQVRRQDSVVPVNVPNGE